MRHQPALRSSAFGGSRVQVRVTPQLRLRVRTVRTDVLPIERSPGPEPCESETEIHSRTRGTRHQFYSAGSGSRRCAAKAARWVRATADSGEYLPHRVQSAPR